MKLDKIFHLEQLGTSVKTEVVAGVTTFLTMAYIIVVNAAIVSETGMPFLALFATTIITSVAGTLMMSLYANAPFAISTGMSLNSSFTYILCIGFGYHWKEGLAIVFIAGMIQVFISFTKISRIIVNSIPVSFNYAITAAIGMFIAYIGIKNAGFISFTAENGSYVDMGKGGLLLNSTIVPKLNSEFSPEQIVGFVSLFTILIFLALEKKNKENYGAYLMGILIATFVGITLKVTNLSDVQLFDLSSLKEIPEVAFSFFGDPGLGSVFHGAEKSLNSVLMIAFFTLSLILNGYATIMGMGQFEEITIFDQEDYRLFLEESKPSGRLSRSLRANAVSSIISAFAGTTPATTFVESATGITSGGKSGLTSLVVAVLFLLCLPFAGILQLIPGTAIAPALILAGCSLIRYLKKIEWQDFSMAMSCSVMILFVTLSYSIVDGIMIGFIVYMLIQLATGKARTVGITIYIFSGIYIVTLVAQRFLL